MSATPPRLSLITCTRNSAKHLRACLDSVKSQSRQPFEHLFIDTNSTDGTLDIIRAYEPAARIINLPEPGLYRALNEGLRQARGNVIGFLHADDVFADADCLQRVMSAFEKNPELGFYCSRMEVYDENMKESFAILGAAPHEPTLRERLYSSNYFAHPTYYCSRSAIEKTGFYDESYAIAGDIDWLLRLEKLGLNFHFDAQPLVKFRSHSGVSSLCYLKALREEWSIQRKYYGWSLLLVISFAWHFTRRLTRLALEKTGLHKTVRGARKLLHRFSH